jgi:hypothetical protein
MSDQYPPSLRKSREYKKDRVAGMDGLSRCANSSWWEWSAGSRRWPEEFIYESGMM